MSLTACASAAPNLHVRNWQRKSPRRSLWCGWKVTKTAAATNCQAASANAGKAASAPPGQDPRFEGPVKEWLDLKDLQLSAQMVLEIVKLNAVGQNS